MFRKSRWVGKVPIWVHILKKKKEKKYLFVHENYICWTGPQSSDPINFYFTETKRLTMFCQRTEGSRPIYHRIFSFHDCKTFQKWYKTCLVRYYTPYIKGLNPFFHLKDQTMLTSLIPTRTLKPCLYDVEGSNDWQVTLFQRKKVEAKVSWKHTLYFWSFTESVTPWMFYPVSSTRDRGGTRY